MALTRRDELRKLARSAREAEPQEFARAWGAFQSERPRARGPGFSFKGLLPRDPNVARDGQAYGLSVLTPVRWDDLDGLRETLHDLGPCEESPFRHMPRTHFARLVVFDRFPHEEAPRLLFSAVLDGTPRSYLRELCWKIPDAVEAIWAASPGSPWPASRDPDAFADWMLRHQFQTSTFFAPYGEATVGQVNRALALRDALRRFELEHQGDPPAMVQRAFVESFVDPDPSPLQ
jgi:hypothetical protein